MGTNRRIPVTRTALNTPSNIRPVDSNSTCRPETSDRRLPEWTPFALIALIWLPALLRFSVEWSINPQYYYGWSVPLLSAYLIYDRWPSRPKPTPPSGFLLPAALIVILALPQLPLRLVGEANTDWRLISWVMGLNALGIGLSVLYLQGGWRWLGFFLLPVLFLLTSIPWPSGAEKLLIQGLMRVNAEFAANIVGFAASPPRPGAT